MESNAGTGTGFNGASSSSMSYAANRTPDRSDNQQSSSSLTTSENNPLRRLMAIQYMLNPSNENVRTSTSSSLTSESGLDDDDRSLSPEPASRDTTRSPRFRGSSRRGRLSSSMRSSSIRSLSSSDVQARSRSFRPAYDEEMADFIWFLKVDRNKSWDEIQTEFNERFVEEHRDKSGLQCKYYRHIKKNGVTCSRAQGRTPAGSNPYGMWANTGHWYSWMERYT
ncbi:MAG: hypothetical protein Q9217_002426 [Psora testacea]